VSNPFRVTGAVLALGVLVAACGGSGSTPAPTKAPGSSAAAPTAGAPSSAPVGSISISGAGATFPYPLYSQWFYQYAFVDPSVKFNYQSIGSGGGIQQITAKTVDFGASDAILNSDQFAAAPGIQMFPSVAGADVVAYNISELKDSTTPLVLDGPTVANIFLGKITNWNDPAIAATNAGVTLPDKPITVVHRSDGSGTTFIFTDYLSNVSPEWKSSVGNATSVEWPVGLGGKGNEGVSGTLGQTDGSIGYVELAYALSAKLAFANLKNAAGNVVTASIDSTKAAMGDFATAMPDTLARSIVNAPGAQSWPIAGYTYLLLYMDQTDCTKAQKLVQFINWAQSSGTDYATQLNYVPLPDSVKQQMLDKVSKITCNGAPLQ
jgi:phosphate transport system substrate-binding protein